MLVWIFSAIPMACRFISSVSHSEDWIASLPDDASGLFEDLEKTLWDPIRSFWDSIASFWKAFFHSLGESIAAFLNNLWDFFTNSTLRNPYSEKFLYVLALCLLGLILFYFAKKLAQTVYWKIKYAYHRKLRKTFHPEPDIKAARERMAVLSESFEVSARKSGFDILTVVNREAYAGLRRMKRGLTAMPARILSLVPSARWLFDNYYLIYRELSAILKTAPRVKKTCPVVAAGVMKGYCRIYVIASEIVLCSPARLTEDAIVALLNAYQGKTPLTSAELWEFPTALKSCLMEKIIETSGEVLSNIRIKVEADAFMTRMAMILRNSNKSIFTLLRENLDRDKLDSDPYLSHVIFCLKNLSADENEIRDWLQGEMDAEKSEHQDIVSEIIRKETNAEAVAKNAIRSLIISLKEISDLDWEDLFEKVSPIEKILRKDPADLYRLMDFKTRDHYRHTIERLARESRAEESRVAQKALSMALLDSRDSRGIHIGAYIVGKKEEKLYKAFEKTRRPIYKIGRWLYKMRGKFYFAGLFVLFAALGALLISGIKDLLLAMSPWKQAAVLALFAVPLLSVCIEIVNQISTALVKPSPVLSMDFSKDIPDSARTFVVMPVILSSAGQALDYVAKLERYYLGNMQNNLYFAILGDYADAPSRETEGDPEILHAAREAIEALNRKYPGETMRFNLFWRYRKFNEAEGYWMGWERKRGKLEEFNALLLGEKDTSYNVIICNPKLLGTFRYVITLDADTELIRESAAKLVGIMAHPLNRPVLNEKKTRVVEGYSIVQSEIRNRLSSVKYSPFSSLFANSPGIDRYSSLVADVYHDTFSEGIFYGKGIYDVRVFHRLFRGTIPENSVLSHDLLESCYARCAFASGVKLMDRYPTGFASYIKREHRWIRGDWQLLPWLFRLSPIGILAKWKVFDNIRRSLLQISWFVLILANFLLFPAAPFLWAAFVFFTPLFQIFLSLAVIGQKFRHLESSLCFGNIFSSQLRIALQGLLVFVLIPHRAWIALDAIVRSLYRLCFSHRKMLEWTTAESVEKSVKNTLRGNLSTMFQSVLAGVLLLLAIPALSLPLAGQIGCAAVSLAWCFGPLVAFLVSRPVSSTCKTSFAPQDLTILRRHARKIWRFIEEHATEETHWLCPDNLQVFPTRKTTEKSSPTNIGLQLLSVLAARDMGYLCLSDLILWVERILRAVQEMEKWHGHLFNWYNIRTLEVLPPRYVSTVDSGNLTGYLITLKNALSDAIGQPVLAASRMEGLYDALYMSGIDYDLEFKNMSAEGFRRALLELFQKTRDERNAWENEKWVPILQETCIAFLAEFEEFIAGQENTPAMTELFRVLAGGSLIGLAKSGNEKASDLVKRLRVLIRQIDKMIGLTDFKKLYDPRQNLFRIGYHVDSQTPDSSRYDLLASEARQASFLAIAKGDAPQKHWFRLGRPLTIAGHRQSLVSWSGSMFEYLMPELIMKSFPNSLISQSCRAIAENQIRFGKKYDIPWGVSEAQYYRFDTDANYQYRAFGIPALSFQSSIQADLVVAPYATMLALGVTPKEAMENIRTLIACGMESEYGFFESMDYTVPDTDAHRPYSIIKSHMMHHQGMSLVAIDNVLHGCVMQRRFHQEPVIQSTELLLEEYNPSNLFTLNNKEYNIRLTPQEPLAMLTHESRIFRNPSLTYPSAHVLCNDRYMLMTTTGGGGFSKCGDIMLNRWRPDTARNLYGKFFYIRNLKTRDIWSSTYYPLIKEPDDYKAVFSLDRAEYIRRDGDIQTHTEITVSPVDNIEVRRITIKNGSSEELSLDVTSYLEIVNDTYESDLAHPAFGKLFNEMEYIADSGLLIAKRRGRNPGDKGRCILHFVTIDGKTSSPVEYETDRRRFIGRGRTLLDPAAMNTTLSLSNTDGQTSDPIASLRTAVTVPSGRAATVSYITGYAESREEALSLYRKYGVLYNLNDIFELSYVENDLEMLYLNLTSHQVNLIQDIVGTIFYPSNLFRTSEDIIRRNTKSQAGLWRFGISGDNPILLLRISDTEDIQSAKEVVMAYQYLRKNLIRIDLVLLNELEASYCSDLNAMLFDLASSLRMYEQNPNRRSFFILQACQMSPEEIDLLLTASRLVVNAKSGFSFWFTREVLLDKEIQSKKAPPHFAGRDRPGAMPLRASESAAVSEIPAPSGEEAEIGTSTISAAEIGTSPISAVPSLSEAVGAKARRPRLEFFNGIGGFSGDGEEYEIRLENGQTTPMPWSNVVANEQFGFLITEAGSGYTWFGNSRENKLTTWSNDPVSDPPSEILYLRDEETGEFSSIACSPIHDGGSYVVRHGRGYSQFEHQSLRLRQKMTVFAAAKDPVKIWHVSIKNLDTKKRTVSVILYVEWVLGVSREATLPYIVTDIDEEANMMTARNVYNAGFGQCTAFVSASEKIASWTGSRTEFYGARGSFVHPDGMLHKELSDNTGAGYDPCGVIKINLELGPKETREVVLAMGEIENPQTENAGNAISALLKKYLTAAGAKRELEKVKESWKQMLGQIRIKTPDRATDILVNHWLLYQVISCRLRARTAFYQCGGAFGFRDQLQDALALLHAEPALVKAQILLHCSRQFREGDVQHWWHAHTGQGIRTRISDDLLWLPFAVAQYILSTGDSSILGEQADYLTGPLLKPDEQDLYFIPAAANAPESVYTHCVRAVEKSLSALGSRGLPLIGAGDWNDGMNRVGAKGQGESVWLGWFLYAVLKGFAPLCDLQGDGARAAAWLEKAAELAGSIDLSAWDGEWYLRAFFDDGTPLGSAKNEECKIDSIAQSWSILSGAGDPARSAAALQSADRHLVKEEDGVICLLTPPFDKSSADPGYIKGYYPGVRENGGQYTHAAVWLAMAHARQKDGNGAFRLLSMMNPIHASASYKGAMKYEQEPYAVTADIYSKDPCSGKGGWSWYTGSAGWMYQALVGELLGVQKRGSRLFLVPAVPDDWEGFTVEYRYGASLYTIDAVRAARPDEGGLFLDGVIQKEDSIELADDGREHRATWRFI